MPDEQPVTRFDPAWVLHESDDLLVLNKPAGLSMLEDRADPDNLWRLLAMEGKHFLVHRLDKGTSGVLLVARSQARQRLLTRQFATREIGKFYVMKVVGRVARGHSMTIDLPLRPGRKSRYRVAGARADIEQQGSVWRLRLRTGDGVEAVTRIRVLSGNTGHSMLLASPLTGRTHQLRVHLSWIGHPIVGDHLYGDPDSDLQRSDRLWLHCHRLVIPGVGSFSAPVPWT